MALANEERHSPTRPVLCVREPDDQLSIGALVGAAGHYQEVAIRPCGHSRPPRLR
jgi:hypothetical protein